LSAVIGTARDVQIIPLDPRRVMVVSCDSAGGIGSKPLDRVRASPFVVGKFTARVALMEILSTGAEPVCVASALSVEPKPTGNKILSGVRAEMRYAQLNPNTPIVNSAEKNVEVKSTGVGVMAVGITIRKRLRVGRCEASDEILAIGLPQVGGEVLRADKKDVITNSRDVRRLMRSNLVHELIPAGSRGVLHEAHVLASDSQLLLKRERGLKLDVRKSAGPATAIVSACRKNSLERIVALTHKPVTKIGYLVPDQTHPY
jgi:AIR synthase related protein, N-terminal domain